MSEDLPLILPDCFETNQCKCLSTLFSKRVSLRHENYLKETIEWLKELELEVKKHNSKDVVKTTRLHSSCQSNQLQGALVHFRESLLYAKEHLKQECQRTKITFEQLLFQVDDTQPQFTVEIYINILLTICTATFDFYTLITAPHFEIEISHMLGTIQSHYNMIAPLNLCLETLRDYPTDLSQ